MRYVCIECFCGGFDCGVECCVEVMILMMGIVKELWSSELIRRKVLIDVWGLWNNLVYVEKCGGNRVLV